MAEAGWLTTLVCLLPSLASTSLLSRGDSRGADPGPWPLEEPRLSNTGLRGGALSWPVLLPQLRSLPLLARVCRLTDWDCDSSLRLDIVLALTLFFLLDTMFSLEAAVLEMDLAGPTLGGRGGSLLLSLTDSLLASLFTAELSLTEILESLDSLELSLRVFVESLALLLREEFLTMLELDHSLRLDIVLARTLRFFVDWATSRDRTLSRLESSFSLELEE